MKMEYKTTKTISRDVINELLEINNSKGLTPENVVESAKNKSSPLHKFFEWDDSNAGDLWRLQQARTIINEVKVFIDEKEYSAFENVTVSISDDNRNRLYKPIVEIMDNEEYRRQIVKAALGHLAYWEQQNGKFQELKPIISTAKKVRTQLEKKWQQKKR